MSIFKLLSGWDGLRVGTAIQLDNYLLSFNTFLPPESFEIPESTICKSRAKTVFAKLLRK